MSSYEIFVEAGNANGDGSEQKPFGTIKEAKEYVKNLKRDLPINITIKQGIYKLDEAIEFNEEDSGAPNAPITYRGEGDVIFTTAEKINISDCEAVSDEYSERFDDSVKGKIKAVKLSDYGITAQAVPQFGSGEARKTSVHEDIILYTENEMLSVAQFPNGEYNYAVMSEIVDKGNAYSINDETGNGVFKGYEERILNWEKAKDAYVGGFFGYDYRYELNTVKSINDKAITLKYGTDFGIVTKESGRYKAYNIPEELDCSGEWYIDRETNILYIYPTTDEIYIANSAIDVINGENVSYVNFEGIRFDKIRGNAIKFNRNARNINITNCKFTNVGKQAISMKGTWVGVLGAYYDGAYNVTISENEFSDIGEGAVVLYGGDRDTLESSNTVISKNKIHDVSLLERNTPAIDFFGVGIQVLNNTIYNIPFHAVNFRGNENKISYNEIYHAGREVYDAGVIYSGRSQAMRGNEVSYNYIHDFYSDDENIGHDNVGIYLDDRLCGTYIHHNIIANGSAGVQIGGGQDNWVEYNIIVGCENTVNTVVWAHEPTSTEPELKKALDLELYVKEYPEILKTYEQQKAPARNKIINNITNSPWNISEKYYENEGIVNDNATDVATDKFVNYQAGDYRIKSQYDSTSTGLSESYNMSLLGIGEITPSNTFSKICPENNQRVDNWGSVYMSWEKCEGVSSYIVKIAGDYEMTDIIIEKATPYEFTTVKNLPSDISELYWQVYAVRGDIQISCEGIPFVLKKGIVADENDIEPMDCIDLTGQFNSKLLYSKSDFDKSNLSDAIGSYGSKMVYTLADELMKKQAENGGYLYGKGILYKLKNGDKNAISISSTVKNSVISISEENYRAIYLLANADTYTTGLDKTDSAYQDWAADVEVIYSDNTTSEKQRIEAVKYYSNYYSSEQIPLFKAKAYSSEQEYTCEFNAFGYKILANPEKQVKGIRITPVSGIGKLYVYAMTGVRPQIIQKENALVINKLMNINEGEYNPCVYVKVLKDNSITIANGEIKGFTAGKNQAVKFILPGASAEDKELNIFVWEKGTMKPLTYVLER